MVDQSDEFILAHTEFELRLVLITLVQRETVASAQRQERSVMNVPMTEKTSVTNGAQWGLTAKIKVRLPVSPALVCTTQVGDQEICDVYEACKFGYNCISFGPKFTDYR